MATDPVTALLKVWPKPPDDDAPVRVRVAWLERMAVMFDEIACAGGSNGLGASAATWAADRHRREAKELAEQLPQPKRRPKAAP